MCEQNKFFKKFVARREDYSFDLASTHLFFINLGRIIISGNYQS